METEDDCVELKDDSSFEVLPSSEEEEYSGSSSMWSDTLNDSLYESMSCSFSSLRLFKGSEEGSDNVTTHSTSRPHLQTESIRNPEPNIQQDQPQVQKDVKNSLLLSTGDEVFDEANCEILSDINDRNAVAEIVEMDFRAFEIIDYRHQESERVGNIKLLDSDETQLPSNDALLVTNMVEDSESQRTVGLSTESDALTRRCNLQTEFVRNSEFESRQNQKDVGSSSVQSADDEVTFYEKCENYCYSINQNAVAEIIEMDSPAFETESQYQENERVENYFISKTFDEAQSSSDDTRLITTMDEDSESQRTSSSLNLCQSESVISRSPLDRKPENTVVEMHPDRNNSSKKLCSLMKHSGKLCSWLRNNKCIQNFVDGAKSSFNVFLNRFELELNFMLGMDDPLRILIIADMADSSAIEETFNQSFGGQVVVSKCQIEEDTTIMPVLPIGYQCALQVVQSRINNARELIRNSEKMIVVSMANFIAEIIPQRWQASTVLCLEDPNLQLNLHNFTSTIPVPNEYIDQARRLTPGQYPFKEQGLAVTLEDVIRFSVKTDSKDAQKFLTGVDRSVNLKSGATILAGMYKKYTSR